MAETFLFSALGGLFVLMLLILPFYYWFLQRLRKCHAATYEALGSPALVSSKSSPHKTWLTMKFLFTSQPNRLGDPALVIVCRIIAALQCVYFAVFFTMFAVLMFVPTHFKGGPHPVPQQDPATFRAEQERMPILVIVLLLMGFFWVSSWTWLHARLRSRHPGTYYSLGSPTLLGDNSGYQSSQTMTWYLFSLRWRQLPDRRLITVCWLMVIFSLSCMPFFAGFSTWLFWDVQRH